MNIPHAGIARFSTLYDALQSVALNPQPLPPKASRKLFANNFDAVALNPQPLPPLQTAGMLRSRLDEVALNPQPLPPKAIALDLSLLRLAIR
jgi:hypothetical protein